MNRTRFVRNICNHGWLETASESLVYRFWHSFAAIHVLPEKGAMGIRDDTEFSRISFRREIPRVVHSIELRENRWKRGKGARVSRVRIVGRESGRECRRRAADTQQGSPPSWTFADIEYLGPSITSARQYPKVLVLHLFLYRASIYERSTSFRVSGTMAIIARACSRWHLPIYIIFYPSRFMIEWRVSGDFTRLINPTRFFAKCSKGWALVLLRNFSILHFNGTAIYVSTRYLTLVLYCCFRYLQAFSTSKSF